MWFFLNNLLTALQQPVSKETNDDLRDSRQQNQVLDSTLCTIITEMKPTFQCDVEEEASKVSNTSTLYVDERDWGQRDQVDQITDTGSLQGSTSVVVFCTAIITFIFCSLCRITLTHKGQTAAVINYKGAKRLILWETFIWCIVWPTQMGTYSCQLGSDDHKLLKQTTKCRAVRCVASRPAVGDWYYCLVLSYKSF